MSPDPFPSSSSSRAPEQVEDADRRPTAVIYCEANFGKIDGKTANGLVRHSQRYRILSVIDSEKVGLDTGTVLDGEPNGIPVCRDLAEAIAVAGARPDAFIFGMAPSSGMLSKHERTLGLEAISLGMDFVNGLHEFLNDDPEFAAAATLHNVEIHDVRRPRAKTDLRMFSGRINSVTCPRIAVLGTDGAIGKRTTAVILTKALNDRGIKAVMIGTGQTGLIQGARYGIALDAIPSQFCSGEMESTVIEAFEGEDPDVIIVEGQGALSHPAYLTSTFILRGAKPDGVVLQHAPGRVMLGDFPDVPMPTPASEINLIQTFADTKVIGLTINHENMTDAEVSAAITLYELELGIPATDALTRSPERLVEMVIASFPDLQGEANRERSMSAPRIEIDVRKLEHNASHLVDLLAAKGIGVTGITKATLGSPRIAAAFARAGVTALGESRIENVEAMRHAGLATPVRLIRSPALSMAMRAVACADVSFVTELEVIGALSSAAAAAGVVHGIVIMVELGDLREGVMPDDLDEVVEAVLGLPGLSFEGIGTNLACRSGVVPDAANMGVLSALATSIEASFGLQLRIISGGNSANLNWALSDAPPGRVNDLRLGESILLGREPLDRTPIAGLHTDAFSFVAEVIESKAKPSMPWGDLAQTAFGARGEAVDQGTTFQTILAAGQQDTDPSGLQPPSGVKILGASSDHLVVDCGLPVPIGSEMHFRPNYSALLRSMTSPFVTKALSSRVEGEAPVNAPPHPIREHESRRDGDGDSTTLATVTNIQSRGARSR